MIRNSVQRPEHLGRGAALRAGDVRSVPLTGPGRHHISRPKCPITRHERSLDDDLEPVADVGVSEQHVARRHVQHHDGRHLRCLRVVAEDIDLGHGRCGSKVTGTDVGERKMIPWT